MIIILKLKLFNSVKKMHPITLYIMIKLDNSKNSFYFCECADWSTVVESQDANSAAKNAVKNMLEK